MTHTHKLTTGPGEYVEVETVDTYAVFIGLRVLRHDLPAGVRLSVVAVSSPAPLTPFAQWTVTLRFVGGDLLGDQTYRDQTYDLLVSTLWANYVPEATAAELVDAQPEDATPAPEVCRWCDAPVVAHGLCDRHSLPEHRPASCSPLTGIALATRSDEMLRRS